MTKEKFDLKNRKRISQILSLRKEELKMKKEKKEKVEKKDKKIDKSVIFRKIMAALLVIFTIVGTCYTFIYLVVNS